MDQRGLGGFGLGDSVWVSLVPVSPVPVSPALQPGVAESGTGRQIDIWVGGDLGE